MARRFLGLRASRFIFTPSVFHVSFYPIASLVSHRPGAPYNSPSLQTSAMDLQETQRILSEYLHELADLFHRVPGSAIFLRYVKSSYQDDPIRSAVELFLFLFAVRYLLAPKYSTKPGVVPLTEDEIDDLVDEWTPEPLVGTPSTLEQMEVDKRTVIVGYRTYCFCVAYSADILLTD